MKKIVVLCVFILSVTFSIAQTSSKTGTITVLSVPEAVQLKFSSEFPAIQPIWEMDDKNYKAMYADPKTNSKGIIVYDPEGKVIHRDTEINRIKTPE